MRAEPSGGARRLPGGDVPPRAPGRVSEGLCAPSLRAERGASSAGAGPCSRVEGLCAPSLWAERGASGGGTGPPGPLASPAPGTAGCCSGLAGCEAPSADCSRLAARAGGVRLPFSGWPLLCLEGLCAPSPSGRSAAPPRLAPVAGEAPCLCAEGLCAPSLRAERGASAAGTPPRALGGLLVGCGCGCLAALFPRCVGLGPVPRRLLVLLVARPPPLHTTPPPPVLGGLAAGGSVGDCTLRDPPPPPTPFPGGASRSFTLFKNQRPWVVCVRWVVVPSPCGPSVSRRRSAARPGPPFPSASCGVTLAGGVAWPCVRRARPPFPLPFPVAPRVPFPFLRTCALG